MDTGVSKTKLITNQPYDESLEVNDSDSEIPSACTSTPQQTVSGQKNGQPNMSNISDEFEIDGKPKQREQHNGHHGLSEEEEEEDDYDEDDSDDTASDEDEPDVLVGAYDPADYDNLQVTKEIKEIFQYIIRYPPQDIELDNKLKPFIPEFIPAVGDIDAFLKVPRCDGAPDNLGLFVLDEPYTKQSDPIVLSLWLSDSSKQHNISVKVKRIENQEMNPKAIENWIENLSELHRSKAPATVHYTRPMPDIDNLMQEWPSEFEELLGKVSLPTADIDCDLTEYADIICGILDIPVHKSRIQSLHVLFTLYSEFKNSQHFKALAEGQKSERLSAPGSATDIGEPETFES